MVVLFQGKRTNSGDVEGNHKIPVRRSWRKLQKLHLGSERIFLIPMWCFIHTLFYYSPHSHCCRS